MGRIARVGPTGQGYVVGAAKQGIFICTKMCCPQPTGRRQCAFCLGRSSTGLNVNPLCSLASASSHLIILRSLFYYDARSPLLLSIATYNTVDSRHPSLFRVVHIPSTSLRLVKLAGLRNNLHTYLSPSVSFDPLDGYAVVSRSVHSQTINIQQQGFFFAFDTEPRGPQKKRAACLKPTLTSQKLLARRVSLRRKLHPWPHTPNHPPDKSVSAGQVPPLIQPFRSPLAPLLHIRNGGRLRPIHYLQAFSLNLLSHWIFPPLSSIFRRLLLQPGY